MPIMAEQEYREDLHRNRSSFVYRGMPNVDFQMVTSLQRNCKDKQAELEPSILESFAKYAIIEDPKIQASIWREMILGQHYSLPTRLLDWTHSALMALHFAVTEDNLDEMNDHDCVVWRIDVHEVNKLLPEAYRKVSKRERSSIFSVEMLSEVTNSLEQYDADMGNSAMVVIEPPSINSRIVNQYSFFSIVPTAMTSVEDFLNEKTNNTAKLIIDKDLRWRIRDMLDQLNISERIVYPGMEGLSKWIARHYFVK